MMILSKTITSSSTRRYALQKLLTHRIKSNTPTTTTPTITSLLTNTSSSTTSRPFATASAGQTLEKIALAHPHKDVLRYEHKNIKFTLKHLNSYAEAMAIGFLESGLTKGDAVLSLMPPHWAEQHILQFACSKSGLILYTLPTPPTPSLLSSALSATSANVLISPENHGDLDYISILKKTIPELRIYEQQSGMPFVTPYFPHLRFVTHTGFDRDNDTYAFLLYKYWMVPTDNLGEMTEGLGLGGDTTVYGELVVKGEDVSVGKMLSNDGVVKEGVWPEVSSVLKREYKEIEGVGVVF